MRLIISPDYEQCSQWAADYVAYKIRPRARRKTNLSSWPFPPGSSPLGMFERLIGMFRKGRLSFQNVVIFNMDEYVGLSPEDEQSYHNFLWKNFFDHIDVKKSNVHLLNGQTTDFAKECTSYEKLIRSYGGIDLLIGGVGEDGHVAFNEPGSSLASRTRVKTLNKNTVKANARFFDDNTDLVPRNVLTIGIATIMDAKEVMIIASGDKRQKPCTAPLKAASTTCAR